MVKMTPRHGSVTTAIETTEGDYRIPLLPNSGFSKLPASGVLPLAFPPRLGMMR